MFSVFVQKISHAIEKCMLVALNKSLWISLILSRACQFDLKIVPDVSFVTVYGVLKTSASNLYYNPF